jgi:2Fe-2S ferredoxin
MTSSHDVHSDRGRLYGRCADVVTFAPQPTGVKSTDNSAGQTTNRVDGSRIACLEHGPKSETWFVESDSRKAQKQPAKRNAVPKITYIDIEGTARTVEAEVGATVMETAIDNDIPGILATCGGSCSCATCHVYVDDDWLDKLPAPELDESDMLDTAHDLKDTSRLSCQLVVSEELDGLIVTTPPRQI